MYCLGTQIPYSICCGPMLGFCCGSPVPAVGDSMAGLFSFSPRDISLGGLRSCGIIQEQSVAERGFWGAPFVGLSC